MHSVRATYVTHTQHLLHGGRHSCQLYAPTPPPDAHAPGSIVPSWSTRLQLPNQDGGHAVVLFDDRPGRSGAVAEVGGPSQPLPTCLRASGLLQKATCAASVVDWNEACAHPRLWPSGGGSPGRVVHS